jgi:hypothetical protein
VRHRPKFTEWRSHVEWLPKKERSHSLRKSEVTVLFEEIWATDNHIRHRRFKPGVTPNAFYRFEEVF